MKMSWHVKKIHFKSTLIVLEVIFNYSLDICPFKCFFWLDILQIGNSRFTGEICSVIVSDHNVELTSRV